MELFICMLMFMLIVADSCFRARRIACYQKKEGTYHGSVERGNMMFYIQFKAKKINNQNIPPKQFSIIFSPRIPYQRSIYFIKYRESIMNTVVNEYMLQVMCFFVHIHCWKI